MVHITRAVLESRAILGYGPPPIFEKWTTTFICLNWSKNLKNMIHA